MASVNNTLNTLGQVPAAALTPLLTDLLTDLTALKSAVDAMATKLNADAGVTDTNYAGAATLRTTT